jgi:hypothetical protein
MMAVSPSAAKAAAAGHGHLLSKVSIGSQNIDHTDEK